MKALILAEATETRFFLEALLREKNFHVVTTNKVGAIYDENSDLLFTELPLTKAAFSDLVKGAKIAIAITARGSIEEAVKMMQLGAFHYLTLPCTTEVIEELLGKAMARLELLQETIETKHSGPMHQIIAESPSMKQLVADLDKIARSHSSVFISGESGTGKEVIAQMIHQKSTRASLPFIKVNCAAIPETLIESEFFGHEKGAFTGALNRRLGRFELAHKGTLLLDEVSEIPIHLQSKLLRVIQEQEVERVGGLQPVRIDVRLVATSNRKMKEAIENKLFREDLYYRLNVIPLHIKPLRERREDMLPLANYFLKRLCLENHKKEKKLTVEAQKRLLEYHFPGNIRELANLIERAVVMDLSDLIFPEHLALDPISCKLPSAFTGLSLEEMEQRMIAETLQAEQQNQTKAARVLGISTRTLRNKLARR